MSKILIGYTYIFLNMFNTLYLNFRLTILAESCG